jgi:hypothetical protein
MLHDGGSDVAHTRFASFVAEIGFACDPVTKLLQRTT